MDEDDEDVEWEDQDFTEKLQDIMPLMIAMATYIGKIVVQFRYRDLRLGGTCNV